MRKNLFIALGTLTVVSMLPGSCIKHFPHFNECKQDDIVTSVSTFATGLNNPRGLKFGPDGNLYVAEAGLGGTNSTRGQCDSVIAPVGPYTGSDTGARILRIDHNGQVSVAADKLPSSQTAPTQGSLTSGVADVAFVGNTLYGLLSGAGCSHGVASTPNAIVKVHADKTWEVLADLSSWLQSHPVQNPEPDDFEPDGTWYSMTNVDGNLYAVEPNHGEIDKVTPGGNISRLIDISASQGHIVPTVIAFHEGNFYVGNLDTFPIQGKSSVFKITPGGSISVFATGFNAILGLTFDVTGGMYVLENTTGNPFPTPGTGDVIRIDRSGARRAIVSGLNLPTGMTYGPDNKLYISNWGFGGPPGKGEILQVTISCSKDQKHE